MTSTPNLAPLLVSLQLTPEQQELIRERTGLTLRTLPYESAAAVARYRFAGIELRVNRGVFSPSPATERAVGLVLEVARGYSHPLVVEVGTGCGAVALAVAAALPDASVIATEISKTAVECARRNRDRLRLRNVSFRCGSLLAPVPKRLRGKISVIVANLPYIPPDLRDSAEGFFPAGTAIGLGEDGLDLVRDVAKGAGEFLQPGGSLVLQLAGFQWTQFGEELRGLGYEVPPTSVAIANAPTAHRVFWPGAGAD
jgi:release factor glutamine methyltransferase